MNQERDLTDRYRWEYERYETQMEAYKERQNANRQVWAHNKAVDDWNKVLKEDMSRLYERPDLQCKKNLMDELELPSYMEHPDKVDLYDYYDEEKFTKAWMLNVSPNWKGVVITREMIEFFEGVINEFYENCNRFTKMKYVLENGHGKDHLHAHIVFTLNTKKPGYMTSIKKGNILNEFRNVWNRLIKDNASLEDLTIDDEWLDPEGYYCTKRKKQIGLIDERCALNTCLLTSKGMYKDKIDYLKEELKPTSHKNDEHPLCPVKGSKGYD